MPRRLGEDGRRELVWGARGTQNGQGQRKGLAGTGRALVASGEGQRAHATMQDRTQQDRTRETKWERLGPRQGPWMGM